MTVSSYNISTCNVVAVVVTHNRPKLLKVVLEALRAQTMPLKDIVIVDNASDLETVEMLQCEKTLKVVRIDDNAGGSGGFAAGIEQALVMVPEWIWLLDDDVIMREDTLENLLGKDGNVERLADDVGVLCPAVEEGGKVAAMHRRYFDPLTLREHVVPHRLYNHPVVEIDTASFVGFLVRAEAVQGVGVPDGRLFLSYDDTEFSLRLKSAGYRLLLIPSSRVDHRRPQCARLRRGPFGLRHYYNLRNRLIIYRKYGRAPAWRWLSPLAQGLVLLLVAGKCRPAALKWWWKAMCDSQGEPYAVRQKAARSDAKEFRGSFKCSQQDWKRRNRR